MSMLRIVITALLAILSHSVLANTFKIEKWTTKNGVPVVFSQAMEVPMLDISIAFAAGSAYDGSQYGLSALTAHMMNQGNAGLDATAIADELADTGAQFDAESSRDMVVFSLRTLTTPDILDQSKKILAQIINHPDFPDEAFNREKKQVLMAIKQGEESADEVANLIFFNTLYKQHPYAHSINGTADTINGVTKNQVIEFYKQYYIANNAVMVLVGAVDSPTAHQIAEQLTQELAKGKPAQAIPKALPLANSEQVKIKFPSSQTMVRLGQIGIDHHSPHYFPLMVGNYILGGGSLVSRLAIEIREKRGLTYGVDSQFVPMSGEGPFLISLSTQNDQVAQALKITKDTLLPFIKEGPNQQELKAAKQYLTGSFPLSLASNRAIATLLLRIAFYRLPDNFLDTYAERINAVTCDEIKQAFKQQVNPEKLVLITVGQF